MPKDKITPLVKILMGKTDGKIPVRICSGDRDSVCGIMNRLGIEFHVMGGCVCCDLSPEEINKIKDMEEIDMISVHGLICSARSK